MGRNQLNMLKQDKLFSGSIVALITPMNSDGSIDYAALQQLIDWHVESGTSGLVIMGTTGEASLVSLAEHVNTVKMAISYANKRIQIIAGCGSASTEKVLAMVDELNPFNPDGYLCVTPYYVKPTQKGLKLHFVAVADACKAPLILYNVPGRTGCDLANETVVELAVHANIVGLKDATGDLSRVSYLRTQLSKNFCLLSGDDISAFDFVQLGGDGLISVSGNVTPRQNSQWCELALSRQQNNKERSTVIFEKLKPLNEALFIESNPIPVKWALFKMNKISNYIRLPLTLPEPQSQIKITEALSSSAISW